MHSFKDTKGREWKLELNAYLLKRVKEEVGVLLTSIADNECKLLGDLHEDCGLLVDVLWCLCRSQAKEHGVVDDDESQATEKFAMGLAGDAIEHATEALVGAITDFFSSPVQRKALTELMSKAKQTTDVLGKSMLAKIEALDPNSLAETITASVLNSPPSAESTHGSTPLEN